MWARTKLLRIGVLSILTLGLSTSALARDDYDCTQLMYDHGLASGAQFSCGYKFYNDNIISRASQCMAIANEYGDSEQLNDALASGLKDFHTEYNNTDSKHALCVDFAENYPSFVHP